MQRVTFKQDIFANTEELVYEPIQYPNLQSKFQWVDGPLQQLPHKCAGCGNGFGRFLHFGLEVEFFGVIYFCEHCFTEANNQMGYKSPAQWTRLENIAFRLADQNQYLLERNKELENAMAALTSVLGVDTESVESDSVVDSTAREVVAAGNVVETESGSSEQNDESGSSDLSDDDRFLNELIHGSGDGELSI